LKSPYRIFWQSDVFSFMQNLKMPTVWKRLIRRE
jgi:hypothetical protein